MVISEKTRKISASASTPPGMAKLKVGNMLVNID
jgi:hypothetical protein